MKRFAIIVALCTLAACAVPQLSSKESTRILAVIKACSEQSGNPIHGGASVPPGYDQKYIACLRRHHMSGSVAVKSYVENGHVQTSFTYRVFTSGENQR